MPLRKYRTVEEIPRPAPLPPGDPENLRAAIELSQVCWGLRPWAFPPGVHKFRSVEEAQRKRIEWDQASRRQIT
jgi:hypothetical protein